MPGPDSHVSHVPASYVSFEQFQKQFGTEEACAEALFHAKWPGGFHCPRCDHPRAYWVRTRKLYQCAHCRHQVSLTAGTVLERSRTPLTKWFTAFYMVSRPEGISAAELKRALQVTYKTAWSMLMKIRYAMSREADAQPLTGNIQIHSLLYGMKCTSFMMRVPGEHPLLIGASMDDEDLPERIKIQRMPEEHIINRSLKASSVDYFKRHYVSPSSEIVQSVYQVYSNKRNWKITAIAKQAQKWIYNTFIAIGEKHLQAYLNEFCYRFNQGDYYRGHLNEDRYRGWNVDPFPLRTRFCNKLFVDRSKTCAANSSVLESVLKLCATESAMTYEEITNPYRFRPHHSMTPPDYAA